MLQELEIYTNCSEGGDVPLPNDNFTCTHPVSVAPPVGYHKVTKNDDLSESEEEVFVRDDPNKKTSSSGGGKMARSSQQAFKMEKTLLVIYVVQSFVFAILVSSLLYYFDSHKHGD